MPVAGAATSARGSAACGRAGSPRSGLRGGTPPADDERAAPGDREHDEGAEHAGETAREAAVGDTLREHGLPAPSGGGATFLQAKTANEVLKSQERRLKLQKLKGELVDRARAEALVFRLARETRDAWVNWPARAAALIAAELELDPATMQKVLEAHVRAHLDELARAVLGHEPPPDLRSVSIFLERR